VEECDVEEAGDVADEVDSGQTYEQLIDRAYSVLQDKYPHLVERKRPVLPLPKVERDGSKKVMWANFAQTAELLRREQEHLFAFVLAELSCDGSLDGQNRLIIKGRYSPRQMESVLKKYMIEFVLCHQCKNSESTLSRDVTTRLCSLTCTLCHSTRVVAPIRQGFHATSKADRRAAKAASDRDGAHMHACMPACERA